MFLGFIHKQEPGFYCISWIPHLSYKVCSRQIFVMLSVNIVFSLSCPQAEKKDHKKRCRRKAGMRRDNRGFGQEKGGLWLAHAFFYSFFPCLSWTNIKCEGVTGMSLFHREIIKKNFFTKEGCCLLLTRTSWFLCCAVSFDFLHFTFSDLVLLHLRGRKDCLGRKRRKERTKRGPACQSDGVYLDIN